MAILGFSLSTGVCQLAWHHEGEFKEHIAILEPGQTHAGILTALIKDFLPMPPKVVATTTGPGSFTSIRIQLATAIGLKIGYGSALFVLILLIFCNGFLMGQFRLLIVFVGTILQK